MLDFVLKYWLQVVFSGILTFLSYMIKKISYEFIKEKNEQKLIKDAMQAILRDRLIQAYNYHMERGYLPIHDRDNILNMYNKYHKLGENGVVDDLIRQLKELPTQKPFKNNENGGTNKYE